MKYSKNLALAFLYGIFLKIYDDIIDNKLKVNLFCLDVLKYFVITLFSIIFYNDAIFSILYFECTLLSLMMDKYYTSNLEKSKDTDIQKDFLALNDNVWTYSCILSGVFVLYHLFNAEFKNICLLNWKNATLFINIIINFFIITMDIYFTPEHASNKKLYARIFVFIILSIFVYYMTFFSNYIYEGNYGIMLMHIGFLLASICFLTLDKFGILERFKNKPKYKKIKNKNKKQKTKN
jgi:hypothetical protein